MRARLLQLRPIMAFFSVAATSASMAATAFVLPTPAIAAWTAYETLLGTYPLLTKSLTSAALSGVSDAITQNLEPKQVGGTPILRGHDWVRSSQVVVTGFIWSGPSAHYWYNSLEKFVAASQITNPIGSLFFRLLLDAILFSPLTILGYFTTRALVDGKGFKEIRSKLANRWARTVLSAWKFWPAVNIFSFQFLPVQYRVLYANIMSIFWTGYLSFMNNYKVKQ